MPATFTGAGIGGKSSTMYQTVYNDEILIWQESKYADNGRLALIAVDTEGMPYLTATVNIPNENLRGNEVAIKDYSENKGILEHLIENGIVFKPRRYVNSGYSSIPICIYMGLTHLKKW